jgi:branched-chain amino acid transport system ATP-binding protein
MLEIRDLEAGYGSAAVLHGIDLAVRAGEIVALIGANGAGKTTLAKVIAGLLPARRGHILLDGAPIERLPPRARIALGIAQVPEGRQIIGGLTVAENLRLGAYALRRRLGAAEIGRRGDEMGRQFPILRERRHEPAGNLSGGQQQMLAIARALMTRPRLLVLDEPSLGLAPALVAEVFALAARLSAAGLAVLLSEQNARLSLAAAARGYVIETGRVSLSGSGAELLGNPAVVERYLGIGGERDAAAAQREAARRQRLAADLAHIVRG